MIYDDNDEDDEAFLCGIKSPPSIFSNLAHIVDRFDFACMKSDIG